ncbi:hypothetical protein CFC21_045596 [Triticum aestivum]|uniref:Uncharacterized protein n=2 Tax=Triticum aestivum TaxID=4565 RepID=A0A9R1FT96_WHEAT|nr:hypothetical protein CFC21_045596 [Triticum aestivum]
MATALRTMAAKLMQKIPAAVQRVRVSSRAPAPADADFDRFGPEFRRALDKIVEKHRKRRRDEALACGAGFSLGALTFLLGVHRLG